LLDDLGQGRLDALIRREHAQLVALFLGQVIESETAEYVVNE
jgi:hypothetical protein